MRGALYRYMASVIKRYPTLQELYQRVKKNPKVRSATNDAIRSTYQRIQADRQRGIDFNKAKVKEKFDRQRLGCGQKRDTVMTVNYYFKFDFGRKSSSGRSGRSDVHESIDLDVGLTKGEINEVIRDKIREWQNDNYDVKFRTKGEVKFSVHSIEVC